MWKIDEFGFLECWLPFGRQNLVINLDGSSYFVSETQLTNLESNSSLIGCDLTVFHPPEKDGMVTPANYKTQAVGTVLANFRKSPDGNFEVLCRVKDFTTIEMIKSGELVETSAAYLEYSDKRRVYNAIALVPEGYAKNGRLMKIKAESFSPNNNNTMITPEEIVSIVDALMAKFDAYEKSEDAMTEAICACKKESFDAGALLGIRALKVMTEAKAIGYEGESLTEAAALVVATKMPNMKVESFSEDTMFSLAEGLVELVVESKVESVNEVVKPVETGVPAGITVKVESAAETVRKPRARLPQRAI